MTVVGFQSVGLTVSGRRMARWSARAGLTEEHREQSITSPAPEFVSVIIPTRNRPDLLKRVVASEAR